MIYMSDTLQCERVLHALITKGLVFTSDVSTSTNNQPGSVLIIGFLKTDQSMLMRPRVLISLMLYVASEKQPSVGTRESKNFASFPELLTQCDANNPALR